MPEEKKVEELSPYFSETVGFVIKARGMRGRKYTCSLQEFRDMEFDELVDLKTEFTDYYKNRLLTKQGGGTK